jgi:hypothetical protein
MEEIVSTKTLETSTKFKETTTKIISKENRT